MGVRVRFAPSPTGLLHLGGARTALFNHLFASARGGQCVLRIEDTDQSRLVPGSKTSIEESLQWLGIHFHESPTTSGPFGPYIQSERLSLYRHYAIELLKNGGGYPCFCSKERLRSLREGATGSDAGYDGRCRQLSARQANQEIDRGTPYTVRLKVPEDTEVVVEDEVYGRVVIDSATINDQVLLKTDGHPTYHLACVVDDHCMEISHVLRGEEWLLSTAKHKLLYSSFGWSSPFFAHLPLLVSRSGEKLSKRVQGTSLQSFRERGFSPQSMVEFLLQLGWGGGGGGGGDEQILEKGARDFSLEGISKNPARVDEDKLFWIQKQYFKQCLQDPTRATELANQLAEHVKTVLKVPQDSPSLKLEYQLKVLQLLEDRIPLVPSVPLEAAYFWIPPSHDKNSIPLPDMAGRVLEQLRVGLESLDEFSVDSVSKELKAVSLTLNVPRRTVMQICRRAIVGLENSPGVAGICDVLGREEVLRRLQHTL